MSASSPSLASSSLPLQEQVETGIRVEQERGQGELNRERVGMAGQRGNENGIRVGMVRIGAEMYGNESWDRRE